jgi:hypothetical protein
MAQERPQIRVTHLHALLPLGYWVVSLQHWGGKWDKDAETKSLN